MYLFDATTGHVSVGEKQAGIEFQVVAGEMDITMYTMAILGDCRAPIVA